jgi:CHAT domain-containing protein
VNLLSWLWSTCVSPVLQKVAEYRVGRVKDDMPRVWWIGTGAASSLPFHAAGNYGYGTSDGFDNCLLQCISSYTPSIKSLEHARMTATKASRLFAEKQSLLVVTMPTTPGQRALAGVAFEEEAIQDVTGQKWAIKSLAHPTAFHVLEEIRTAKIVHFACHGSSDTANPMASHLLLQKEDGNKKSVDKLTVSALLDSSIQPHAWIAYLSACSTAEVKTQKLADESLHLTSAFQMAGFAHVIGSLRPADDQICVQVAKLFYSFLVNNEDSIDLNRAVPEALNYAVRQISKDHPNDPSLWAPFIHLGA